MRKKKFSKLAGRTKYGPQNRPITARVQTKRYNYKLSYDSDYNSDSAASENQPNFE